MRAQCLPLFLQGGWGGQLGLLGRSSPQLCSSSLFGECHFSYSPESESEWRGPGRRRICGSIVFGQKRPDAGPWGPAPSGEERCTPHYTVPVSPQCPQEISSANPAVFQGAAVSSERFSQSHSAQKVAELGDPPPLRGSLEQLDRPSPCRPSVPRAPC